MSICHCGAQAGYEHDPLCPFPLFNDNPPRVERWNQEYELNKRLAGMVANDVVDSVAMALNAIQSNLNRGVEWTENFPSQNTNRV